jgi:transcriptional regulator with XRE-family HTH domain
LPLAPRLVAVTPTAVPRKSFPATEVFDDTEGVFTKIKMSSLQNIESIPRDPRESPAAGVGEAIRRIRQRRRLTLRELGDRANLSQSFLSQLERGLAQVSIGSMRRIADALEIQVSDLFLDGADRAPRVLHRDSRPTLPFGDGATKALLTSQKPLENIEALHVTFAPQGSTGPEPYTHGDSEELLLVLEGTVRVELGGRAFALGRGDAIDYRSSVPHRIINVGAAPAEVLFVVSPPSY